MAWLGLRARERRVAIFYFGANVPRLLGIVSEANLVDASPLVVDLTWSGTLKREHPYLRVQHVSQYHLASRVRSARYLAAAWLQRLPFRLVNLSRAAFIETFADTSGAVWWQFEISLQEKIYLSVRLIEVVREIARRERLTHFIVVGEHDHHTWKRSVIEETCARDGLAAWTPSSAVPVEDKGDRISIHRLVETASERYDEPLDAQGRPVVRKGRYRIVRSVGEPLVLFLSSLVTRLSAVVLLLPFFALLAVVQVVLMIGFVLFVGPYLVWWASRRGRGVPSLLQAYRGAQRSAYLVLRRNVARLTGAVVLLAAAIAVLTSVDLGAWLATVLAIVVVLYALLVVLAPASLSIIDMILWPLRSVGRWLPVAAEPRRVKSLVGGVVRWLLRLGRSPSGGVRFGPRNLKRVVFLIDEGNLKPRYNVSRRKRSEYIPYLEGVIEAFRRQKSLEVLIVSYGQPFVTSGPIGRLAHWWRRLGAAGWIKMQHYITPDMHLRTEPLRRRRIQEWSALAADPAFRTSFQYEGVSLWAAVAKDLESFFIGTYGTQIYQQALERILRRVRPDLIVSYNFEGVFRRWIPVPIRLGIPILGMQQALGPYVHGLDHVLAGYSQSKRPDRIGAPTPDKIAVWGQMHYDLLQRYGYTPETLSVCGYPRTDTYVNERGDLARATILRKLGIRDPKARIVAYTAVLRVLHTGLMREDHWVQTFRDLVALTLADPHLYVIVKPWGGDNVALIHQALSLYGNRNVRFIDPNVDIHNVELLSVVDVLAGTFSSIFSETLLMGAIPVLLDYPETRYYFGPDYVDQYKDSAIRATSPAEARAAVRTALDATPEWRSRFRDRALASLVPIFGPMDGRSADRVARTGIDMLGGVPGDPTPDERQPRQGRRERAQIALRPARDPRGS